jgi:hypothetical protein
MRKLLAVVVFFSVSAFSTQSQGAVNEIIGLVLDFPVGSLDSTTKIELYIDRAPTPINLFNSDGYTKMDCNRTDPNDLCPGYKNVGGDNYIKYYYPSYNGPAIPGGLGNDWQRIKWAASSPKITYMGGTDTLQSGIIDGYYYQTHPVITNVVLTGYPGRTKFKFFDTNENVTVGTWPFIIIMDVWVILVEDDWTLSDAVMALQIMAGIEPPPTTNELFDINADGKIGMAEAVYILQKISGAR